MSFGVGCMLAQPVIVIRPAMPSHVPRVAVCIVSSLRCEACAVFPRQLHAPASDLATVRRLRAILAATPRFVNGAELRAVRVAPKRRPASSTAASQQIERQGRPSGTGRTETDRLAIDGRCAQRLQWGRVRGRSRPAADIAPPKEPGIKSRSFNPRRLLPKLPHPPAPAEMAGSSARAPWRPAAERPATPNSQQRPVETFVGSHP
jgi:hypothetical protein